MEMMEVREWLGDWQRGEREREGEWGEAQTKGERV